ncbi:glycosyltransferase [Bacillus sp. ISL-35]|uniref:glycosyltransferase family 2 protein n=1 Tax=Bacillus sp. ISL-35 TaxID=2819122 RepID=UPI001BECFB10|nr:glycosyltransferase [Bacillus sp. ISL-35]MBT2678821.1 glycosyltransferase [Bacillus sp. ISL-35]MBT2703813.1 glycosyltransferase [Chryseobacterium sp. ISL-80]
MISVIVPVYNVEKFLPRCIESILNQTYNDLELILVNDGSPDNCAEICNQYEKQDARIRVIHKKNGGVSSARNSGIEAATGEFILFVDSDDYLDLNMCEVLMHNQEQTNCDIVICGYKSVDANHEFDYNLGIEYKGNLIEMGHRFSELLEKSLLNVPWNKLIRKSLIKVKFDTEMDMGEDLVFNLSYLENVEYICSIKDALYNYYNNQNSATNNKRYIPINITEDFYRNIKNFCDKSVRQYEIKPIYMEFMDSLFSTVQYISERERNYNKKKRLLSDCFNNEFLQEIYSVGSFYRNYEKKFVCGLLIKFKFYNLILFYFLNRKLIKRFVNINWRTS